LVEVIESRGASVGSTYFAGENGVERHESCNIITSIRMPSFASAKKVIKDSLPSIAAPFVYSPLPKKRGADQENEGANRQG
jgi:hypothetical protein